MSMYDNATLLDDILLKLWHLPAQILVIGALSINIILAILSYKYFWRDFFDNSEE